MSCWIRVSERRCLPADFMAAASRVFNSGNPSPLQGTHFAAVPGQRALDAAIPPDRLVAPIRRAIREINPNQTVFDVKTIDR